MSRSQFIYDASVKNADIYYATGFLAHDAFIFFTCGDKKYLVMSDLEIDRAKKESCVDEVLSLSFYAKKANERVGSSGLPEILDEVFREKGITSILAPDSTSFALVDNLRRMGYEVEAGPSPFFQGRLQKTAAEKKAIADSQKVVFQAMKLAEDTLKKSKIKGRKLSYKGQTLTSERLRQMIEVFLLEKGFAAEGTIVASGPHSIDPHEQGSGPLAPNTSIVVDIFPRNLKTRFYGDATRTFCRGRASDALRKMYDVVKRGQQMGLDMVRAGINGRGVHDAITDFFAKEGYPTCERGGRMVGFFHGTGHSLGLEIHEEPARIRKIDYTLAEGNVMSVEPGLYYPEIGGVRIEDIVFIKKSGCDVLGKYPKRLEIV